MQFKAFIPFALVAVAIANPVEVLTRDLPTVNTAIDAVKTALSNLDTAVKALSATSDPATSVPQLNSLADAVLNALKTGTTNIAASTSLTLPEALNIASSTQALTNQANTTVTDLVGKKSVIDAAGQTQTVLGQLTAQKAATQAFADAINTKVPTAAQAAGKAIGAQAVAVINAGITAYGGSATKREIEIASL